MKELWTSLPCSQNERKPAIPLNFLKVKIKTALFMLFLLFSCFPLWGQSSPEAKILSMIQKSDIPPEFLNQLNASLLTTPNCFLSFYNDYQKKAVIPPANQLLLSIPSDDEHFLGFQKVEEEEGKKHLLDRPGYTKHVLVRNKQAAGPNIKIELKFYENSRKALLSNLVHSFLSTCGSARPHTWSGADIPVIETPFDFTANSTDGPYFSVDASYFNLGISIIVDDGDLEGPKPWPRPMPELKPVFDSFVNLFHGYKTAKEITPVKYLDFDVEEVTSSGMKQEGNDTPFSVYKIDCPFRRLDAYLENKYWIIAISDKGELSMKNAHTEYLQTFRRISGKIRNGFFHPEDKDIERSAIPGKPGSVFLKLPSNETEAELTFYFITKDLTAYCVQKLTLARIKAIAERNRQQAEINRPILDAVKKYVKTSDKSNWNEIDIDFLKKAYSKYPKKAKQPEKTTIMLKSPDNYCKFMENENWESVPSTAEDKKSYTGKYCLQYKKGQYKIFFSFGLFDTSMNTLSSVISNTYMRYTLAAAPNSWDGKPVMQTPFDFTANFGSGYSLDASYYNLKFHILLDMNERINQMSLTDYTSIFNRFTDLFHGYKTAKEITPVDYFNFVTGKAASSDLTNEKVDETFSVYKIVCPFKEKHQNLKDKYWVLVVADKGELSMEKENTKYSMKENLDRSQEIYYVPKNDKEMQFSSIPKEPDTVCWKLPKGETNAEITFYFISEDGTKYSSQKLTAAQMESAEEKSKYQSAVINFDGTITDTKGNRLDDVKLSIEFRRPGVSSDGTDFLEKEQIANGNFSIQQKEYTSAHITFSKEGYYSDYFAFYPDLPATSENQHHVSIQLKKKSIRPLYIAIGPMEIQTMEENIKKHTKQVCNLSHLDDYKKVLIKEVESDKDFPSKYLELDFKRDANGEIIMNQSSATGDSLPEVYIIRMKSPDPGDGLILIDSDVKIDGNKPMLSDFYEAPKAGYQREIVIPRSKDTNSYAKSTKYLYVKCGNHYGKMALDRIGGENTETEKKYYLRIKIMINSKQNDTNLVGTSFY